MKMYNLLDMAGQEKVDLTLRPGNVLLICSDDGPTGYVPQSMSVTCPSCAIHWFPDQAAYEKWAGSLPPLRKGVRPRQQVVVVGFSATANFSVTKHEGQNVSDSD